MPTTEEAYALWTKEIIARDEGFVPTRDNPGTVDRNHVEGPIDGFYRVMGAKTKHDMPIGVWRREGADHVVLQYGDRQPQTVPEDGDAMLKFRSTWFLSCAAVRKAEWDQALATGFWADGKPAKEMTDEQVLERAADIIPAAADSEGRGTNIPPEEQKTYDQQIAEKMAVQLAAHKKLGKIDTAEKATQAAAILEAIRALGKLGNARREADRAPHLAAAQAVQNVWLPILTPGSELVPVIVKEISDYTKAEAARLQRIEDEKAEAERKRLQAIKDEEARVERERLQKIADEAAEVERQRRQKLADDAAAAKGQEAEVVEVKAEEVVVEAEKVEVKAETVAAPKVSTTFGRAVSKAKVKKGRITDLDKFIAAIKEQQDFVDFLQTKANALARARTKLDGMEIVEE